MTRRNMKNKESVLWGVRDGDEDWQEVILSTQLANFTRVKELASKDGYGRFRIATVDLSIPPDFASTVNTSEKKGAS